MEGTYSGRLAWDHASGYHLAETGDPRPLNDAEKADKRAWLEALDVSDDHIQAHLDTATVVEPHKVVTEDRGKTWRYAAPADTSHTDRYHERFVTVNATQPPTIDKYGRPVFVPGNEHHFEPAEAAKLEFLNDSESPKVTGHTDSWKDQ